MDFQGHFQQYFDYIMVGSFIERENRCTLIDKTRDLPKVTHKRYMIFKIKKDELFSIDVLSDMMRALPDLSYTNTLNLFIKCI